MPSPTPTGKKWANGYSLSTTTGAVAVNSSGNPPTLGNTLVATLSSMGGNELVSDGGSLAISSGWNAEKIGGQVSHRHFRLWKPVSGDATDDLSFSGGSNASYSLNVVEYQDCDQVDCFDTPLSVIETNAANTFVFNTITPTVDDTRIIAALTCRQGQAISNPWDSDPIGSVTSPTGYTKDGAISAATNRESSVLYGKGMGTAAATGSVTYASGGSATNTNAVWTLYPIKGVSGGGGVTEEVSVSYSVTATDIVAVDATAETSAAYSLVATNSVSADATAEASAAYSLVATNSVSADAIAESSIVIPVTVDYVVTGSVTAGGEIDADLIIDQLMDVNFSGEATAGGSLAPALNANVVLSGGAVAEVSVSASNLAAFTAAAGASAEASFAPEATANYAVTGTVEAAGEVEAEVNFNVTLAATAQAEATALASIVAGAAADVTFSGGVLLEASLTETVTAGLTLSGDVSQEAGVIFGAVADSNILANASAEAGISSAVAVATQLAAQAAAESGLALGQLLSVDFTGTTVSASFQTADERRFAVPAESRILTVKLELRRF